MLRTPSLSTASEVPSFAPDTRIIEAEASAKWDLPGAVAELVDNALGSARGDAAVVRLDYQTDGRVLTIADDGLGMYHPMDLLRLGHGIGAHRGDIGRYGAGGSKACIWLAQTVSVRSRCRDGLFREASAHWADVIAGGDWRRGFGVLAWPAGAASVDGLTQGTVIELALRVGRRVYPEALTLRLTRLYAPALRAGRQIWVNGTLLAAPSVPAGARPLAVSVRVAGQELTATGAAWIDEGASLDLSGLDIAYGHRVILPNNIEALRRPDGTSPYMPQGVCGYVDLGEGWQAHLTTVKDDIKDETARDALLQALAEQLAPLCEQRVQAMLHVRLRGLELKGAALLADRLGSLLTPGGTTRQEPSGVEATYTWTKRDTGATVPPIEVKRQPDRAGRAAMPASAHVKLTFLRAKALPGRVCEVFVNVRQGTLQVFVVEEHEAAQAWLRAPNRYPNALMELILGHVADALRTLPEEQLRPFLRAVGARAILDLFPADRWPFLYAVLSGVAPEEVDVAVMREEEAG